MPATPVNWLPNFRLSTGSFGTGNQFVPQFAQMENGSTIVVWRDDSGTNSVIRGRIVDPAGNFGPLISNFGIPDSTPQFEVAATPGGGFAMVLLRASGNNRIVEVRQFDDDGVQVGSRRTMDSGTAASLGGADPSIAVQSNGDYLVTYQDVTNGTTYTNYVHVDVSQLPGSSALTGNTSNFRASTTSSSEEDSTVAALSNGGFVMAYVRPDDSIDGVLFDAAGNDIMNLNISSTPITSQEAFGNPDIAALAGGGFVVTWSDEIGFFRDTFARVYSDTGVPLGQQFAVNSSSGATYTLRPSVAALSDGGFVIVYDNEGANTIEGQRFDSTGTKVGNLFTVTTDIASEPEVIGLEDGRFMVTYQYSSATSNGIDIATGIWDTRDVPNGTPVYVPDPWIVGTVGDDTIQGTMADETIDGHLGNDLIRGGDGDDDIRGGLGADTLFGEGGDDVLVSTGIGSTFIGGAGADTITPLGADATISYEGSDAGVDIVLRSSISNVGIAPTGGHAQGDRISSLNEQNIVRLIGSDFDDTLFIVNTGTQTLIGGLGNDRLRGGEGSDVLNGGDGIDSAEYATGGPALTVDLLNASVNTGEAAGDVFISIENLRGTGDLRGDNDDNSLFGGSGDDFLTGRGGDDALFGSSGDDALRGGAGADTFIGGSGIDRVLYDDSTTGLTIFLNGGGTGIATGDSFNDIEEAYGSNFDDRIFASSTTTRLEGLDGDDELVGFLSDIRLGGGNGDDILVSSDGITTMIGGAGTDTASYTRSGSVKADLQSAQFNTGWAAGDTYLSIENLRGSGFDDDLRGDNGVNVIEGLSGNDFLTGRNGDDTLFGGDGNDGLVGGVGADSLNGGRGTDRVLYTDSATGLRADLQFAATNTGIAAGDTYAGIEDLRGSNGNDDLRGDAGDNRIEGLAGDDILVGRAGNDVLIGAAGDDLLVGGAGGDSLQGGTGIDRASYVGSAGGVTADLQDSALNAGADAVGDTFGQIEGLQGSAHVDDLRGDGGDNLLIGGFGGDFLTGRIGDDMLIGGADDDVLRGGGGADSLDGGLGIDRADYVDALSGVKADLQFAMLNTGIAAGDTYVDIENLRAGVGDDDLRGDAQGNLVEGLDGDDYLTGRDGDDTLRGGNGDDVLVGGTGIDILAGNGGNDVFRFNTTAEGIDTILDFQIDRDRIALDDAGFTALTLGALSAGNFRVTGTVADADDYIIYDIASGALYYDADGSGSTAAIRFATLSNMAALDAGDFLVV